MNWFDKLKIALAVISTKGELRQPQNFAMEREAKGYSSWYVAQQYAYDIDRILRELNTAYSFVSQLPDSEFLKKHSISEENYILYHQGYFLDLVHQFKDKNLKMLRAIIFMDKNCAKDGLNNATEIKKLLNGDIKVSKNILSNKYVLKMSGLIKLVKELDELDEGVIGKALAKRTQYHHKKNTLSSIESYSKANSLRSFLDPKFSTSLSEYGKKHLAEKVEENLLIWQKDGSKRMKEILDAVKTNLEGISKCLIKYYKFPSFVNSASLINWNLALWDKLKIKKNLYTKESISEKYKGVVETTKQALISFYGDNLVSIYLAGSILRDDFIPNLSDINFLTIIKEGDKLEKISGKILLYSASRLLGPPINNEVITKNDFQSAEYEKIRFICKSDGILLFGEDLLKDEKDEKICFNLAWKLNKDFKDYIAKTKNRVENNPLTDRQRSLIVRTLAKRAYWISFSMVIGNDVLYTSNFKKMRDFQNFYYPSNRKFNDALFKIIRRGAKIDKETLLLFIKRCEELLFPMYDVMEKYCDKENPQLIAK